MDEVAKSILSILKETTALLIESLASDTDDSAGVTRLGGRLLDLLDKTGDQVGIYNVEYNTGNDSSLEARLESFYKEATSFDEKRGGNSTMCLKHLQTHSKSLSRVLESDWNTGLPHPPAEISAAGANKVATPEKTEKSLKVLYKFTPLKTERETKDCPFCGQVFGIKSLANHIRDKHKEDNEEKGEKEKNPEAKDKEDKREEALGTCRMPDKKNPNVICGRKFPSDRIKRHLKDHHSYDEVPPNIPLRGFISENGRVTGTPIFLRKAEKDPEFDVLIQPLDSSPADTHEDEEVDGESQTLVLEADEGSQISKKRLFSNSDEEDVSMKMVDKSAEADMSYEEEETECEKSEDCLVDKSAEADMSYEEEETECEKSEDCLEDLSLPEHNSDHSVNEETCSINPEERQGLAVKFDEGQSPMIDIIPDLDSDYEDGDSGAFTRERMKNKAERHEKRINLSSSKLAEKDGNIGFKTKFDKFLLNRGIIQSKNDRSAHKVQGHVYGYHNSFLAHETKENNEFFLDRLLAFKSDDYLAPKFPLDWIQATCSNDPSRAVEMLKAHKIMRDFLKETIDKTDFGGSTDDMLKKTLILDGIEKISREIQSKGLFASYAALIKIETAEKRQARMLINPSEAHNVARAVTKWNESEESREREAHFIQICQDAVKSGQIKSRAFTTLGHYVRFRMEIIDKNRPNSYRLLNSDIATAKKLYWPEGYTGFGDLPDGWDENVSPSAGTEPSAYSITVPGKTFIKDSRILLIN